jgi:uncharacterized membrane protein YsdA (DUF1294 family)
LISPAIILASAVATWLLVMSVATFALFGIDKRLAVAGAWRISESTLLTCALIGGSLGAVAGQRFFRHKTQKQPFRASLQIILLLQIAGVAALGLNPHMAADFFQEFSAARLP